MFGGERYFLKNPFQILINKTPIRHINPDVCFEMMLAGRLCKIDDFPLDRPSWERRRHRDSLVPGTGMDITASASVCQREDRTQH